MGKKQLVMYTVSVGRLYPTTGFVAATSNAAARWVVISAYWDAYDTRSFPSPMSVRRSPHFDCVAEKVGRSFVDDKYVMALVKEHKRREKVTARGAIRAGDTVRHGPTGETWLVAIDEDRGRVYWCGYPFGGCGEAADCEVIEQATDEERREMLVDISASGDECMAEMAKRQLRNEEQGPGGRAAAHGAPPTVGESRRDACATRGDSIHG